MSHNSHENNKTEKTDKRHDTYRDLHENFHDTENAEKINTATARSVLEEFLKYCQPDSVLDVGCGIGVWLSTARSLGINNVFGVDGPWLKKEMLRVEKECVQILDLEQSFSLKKRFDLVMSIEVAEHLTEIRAESFVQNLIDHGDVIIFSAAVPRQGGHNHLNEQWPEYWEEIFRKKDFICIDLFRPRIWNNKEVYLHIRQNVLLFISKKLLQSEQYKDLLNYRANLDQLSLIHPDSYMGLLLGADQLIEIRNQYENLIKYFSKGGNFSISFQNNELNISKIE